MSDREWSDGKTRWLTGVEAEVFASTQSLKRAISMMKARQLETDCDVDEAEWLNTDIDRLSQLAEKEQGRLEGAHEGGEVVGRICDDGLGAYVELHDDYSFTVGQPVYIHPSASVPGGSCEHGIRHPHPCRECEDREPPPERAK